MFKDAFILFLIENGIADNFAINNKNTYTRLPEKIGCIENAGEYIVYHTDEFGQVFDERKFNDQFKAYYYMGKEYGLNFGDWLKNQKENTMGKRTI